MIKTSLNESKITIPTRLFLNKHSTSSASCTSQPLIPHKKHKTLTDEGSEDDIEPRIRHSNGVVLPGELIDLVQDSSQCPAHLSVSEGEYNKCM